MECTQCFLVSQRCCIVSLPCISHLPVPSLLELFVLSQQNLSCHPLLSILLIPSLFRPLYCFILLQLATAGSFPLMFLPLLHVFYTIARALLSKTELSLFTPKQSWSACHASGIMTGPRDSQGFKHHPCSGAATKTCFCNSTDGSILFRDCSRPQCFRGHRPTTTWRLSNW